MNEELFTEIAIEAIAPRKEIVFTTSEKISIRALPKDIDTTLWTLKRGDNRKTFISRNGLDEVETVTIMMYDFFNGD